MSIATAPQKIRTFLLTANILLFAALPVAAQTAVSSSKVSFTRVPVTLVQPGTTFGEQPPEQWSNLISFVDGKLTRGDVDAVTETVRYYAEIFNLVMLANVEIGDDQKYELDDVGIGFSMKINDKNVFVTSDTQSDLGGNLSLIGRGVLDGNVEALAKVEQVARTSHSILIDAPATLLRNGAHREMIVRYYIWVFPENGNVGTLVWLLDPANRGKTLLVADSTVQLLPPNMREERIMNVKKSEFNFLGIPSKKAFALVQIPQGTAFEMTPEMKAISANKTYTPESFAQLADTIAQTLQSGKKL